MKKTIIGFIGRKSSGKSTCAQWCHQRFGTVNVPFAGNVKELARRVFPGVPEKCWFGNQEDKEAEILLDGDWLNTKGEPTVVATSGREILQNLGNEARNVLGDNVWINAALAAIDQTRYPLYTIDDVRYVNEAVRLKKVGAVLVKLYNESIPNDDEHPSEAETDQIPNDLIDLEIRHKDYGGVLERLESFILSIGMVPVGPK